MVKKKMEKVKEPKHYGGIKMCDRCDEQFCFDCIDFRQIDFDVGDNILSERPDLEPTIINRRGDNVCPWCYNQLIDLKEKEDDKNVKRNSK